MKNLLLHDRLGVVVELLAYEDFYYFFSVFFSCTSLGLLCCG